MENRKIFLVIFKLGKKGFLVFFFFLAEVYYGGGFGVMLGTKK